MAFNVIIYDMQHILNKFYLKGLEDILKKKAPTQNYLLDKTFFRLCPKTPDGLCYVKRSAVECIFIKKKKSHTQEGI